VTISWGDYKGQCNSVKYMQNCISSNRFPSAILITGPPGVGKSLLTELTIRSVICDGDNSSVKPCGKCEYCTTNIREMDNVRWHQVTNVTGMTDYLNDTSLWAKEAPLYLNGIGFTRKFVVLDEIQLLNSNYIQSLLGYIDSSPNTTTWILISMDLSRFSITDLEALSSRCTTLSLNSHTVDSCIDYITSKWSFNKADAQLLATLSDGNMRQIGSLVDYYNGVDNTKPIAEILVGGANNRQDFWHNLYHKNYKAAINICDGWLRSTNNQVLMKLLINDVINELSITPNDSLIHDLDLLVRYSSNNIKVSLSNFISLLYGFKQEKEILNEVIHVIKDVSTFTSIKDIEDYYIEHCIY
jgi:DNA polymerase III gamma/tau subunit